MNGKAARPVAKSCLSSLILYAKPCWSHQTGGISDMNKVFLIGLIGGLPLIVASFLFPSFGVDGGSYLMTRNWVLGQDYTGLMAFHTRPPLIGLVLVGPTFLLGDLWATKLMSAIAMICMAPAGYFLSRAWLPPTKAVWATALITLNPVVFTLAAGGYLSIMALALSLVILRLVIAPTKQSIWAIPLAAFALVGLNQTIPVNMALLLLLWPRSVWNCRLPLFIGVLASLAWSPWLLVNATADGISYEQLGSSPLAIKYSAAAIMEWGGLIILVPLLFTLAAMRYKSPVMLALSLSLALSLFASNHILLNNVLSRFTPYVPVWLAIHLVLQYGRSWEPYRVARLGFGAVLVGSLILTSFWRLPGFNMLSDDFLAGVDYLKSNAAQTDKIASYPHGSGRWIGGLAGMAWAVPWGNTPPELYAAEYENYKCTLGWVPCDDSTASEMSWVIADWSFHMDAPVDKGLAENQSALGLAWEQGDVQVYKGLAENQATLGLAWEQGDVQVYKVLRPIVPRGDVSGRTWPWNGRD
jgi:hypothetical protein